MFEIIALLVLFTLSAWLVLRSRDTSLVHLPGPNAPSWIIGSQAELLQSEAGMANRQWSEKFGSVYRFQSCFGVEWLMLNDPKAIAHVLQGQTTTYHLEESLREFLRQVTGKGIVYADGPDHARQRRLLQPSFNPLFVKGLAPKFAGCASRVAQVWQQLLSKDGKTTVEVNMYEWAERLTMESIGQTAFGVRFGTIEGEKHELAQAYYGFVNKAFSQPNSFLIVLQALALHMPPWILFLTDRLPLKSVQTLRAAQACSLKFARSLIREKRQQLKRDKTEDRDILSTLTRAGEEDAGGKFTPMSDEEVYAQLTTFFVAGYETSCDTLTFAMYEIARNADVQARLYAEVTEVLGRYPDAETMEYQLHEQMPYLQAVIKETLRLHAVIAHGIFKAGADNVIPLSKPITIPGGKTIDSVPVRKGQRVFLSFDGLNRSQFVWGPDAHEFKPERWLSGSLDKPSPDTRCGGPYANISTFGGGPKTCLGWRFAVIELQAFVAVLVSRFHLRIAPGYSLRKDGCSIAVGEVKKVEGDGCRC